MAIETLTLGNTSVKMKDDVGMHNAKKGSKKSS